ncbi:hypothetical protein GE061_018980 [Apolygus lucorum]|uniref:Uncharacterized protein n=1 Tax=Apolygus lucorum TaxID=248454 RepID=A0A6A4JSE4_APOLU|nr:hypothetical protein GE061_018980 [Apolygus lucorum]
MPQTLDKYLQRGNKNNNTPPRNNNTPKRPRSSPEEGSGREKRANKMGNGNDDALLVKFSTLLDTKMSNLATKDDITVIRTEIQSLREENNLLRKEVAELKTAAEHRDRRVEFLEMNARRNNLVLRGLTVRQGDNLQDVVQKFFTEVLKIDQEIEIDSAWLIAGSQGVGVRGAMVIVTLQHNRDKWLIIGKTHCLRGTDYNVSQDFPPTMRTRISKLLRIRAELRKKSPGAVCRLRSDKLMVGQEAFVWDDKSGLKASRSKAPVSCIGAVNLSPLISSLLGENGAVGPVHDAEKSAGVLIVCLLLMIHCVDRKLICAV